MIFASIRKKSPSIWVHVNSYGFCHRCLRCSLVCYHVFCSASFLVDSVERVMECNKDEAVRAKVIAERKFSAKDLEGAKKFALKASQLYPALEGIAQMVSTFDVYSAAEKKINGESDWYGILCVNAGADDESVRKQYRKLALMLHPDKNKSIGAEGAFKLISEAWSVLSDKFRRAAYDQKRNFKQTATQSSKPVGPLRAGSAVHGAPGNCTFSSANAGSHSRTKRTVQAPSMAPRQSKPSTFWTACTRCRMQYEYLRMYVNHNLLCPNCREPFLAVETGTVPSASGTFPWTTPAQNGHTNQNMHGKNFHNNHNAHFHWGQFPQTSNVSTSTVTTASNLVHPSHDKVKRVEDRLNINECKRTLSGLYSGNSRVHPGGIEAQRPAKRRSLDQDGMGDDDVNRVMGMANGVQSDARKDASELERPNGVSRGMSYKQCGGTTKDSVVQDTRTFLMLKARNDINKKLSEWKLKDAEKDNTKTLPNSKENVTTNRNGILDDRKESGKPSIRTKSQERSCGVAGNLNEETIEPSSIHVIDPDFHDFDKDRSEKSFEANQVWAAYDDDDGMPRFYALVQQVLTLQPFKMRISWLNSKSNSELGPINWVASGFTKTSGEFRVGRYATYNSANVFSHKVRWEKGFRGVIRIVPGKGEIWAIYRNWSKDWNESTPDEVIHKYDVVEVLDDFVEDRGVSITPLVKIPGFKTVFQRVVDKEKIQIIPREELFRLSHQVPFRVLTGAEAENAPKGCLELDPAAMPLELLQVITNTKNDVTCNLPKTGDQ